ncbi:MAG TPA: M28 family peptidase [Burkholderiales bacterium]|nr:M28 family peptidase [Burkholderiales bacterium]
MLGALFAVALGIAGLLYFMIRMPGSSHAGPLPPLTGEARALSLRLRLHVAALAAKERNVDLETPAGYIEQAFRSQGLEFAVQDFVSGGRTVRNIEAGAGDIVVGAHYDTVPGSPGANDNASGVAVLIELAAMKVPVRLVAFANEEPPYSFGPEMGSWTWAMRARGRSEPIRAMFSLEMLGYYRDAAGSQRYPAPLGLFYPDRADFIAFVGDLGARGLVRRSIEAFRKRAKFPSEGVAAPSFIPGVTWSDHWSFRRHGYPAIMITDTAFYRYPHYHLPSDTPDKLDYERMARVTLGLAAMLNELADQTR